MPTYVSMCGLKHIWSGPRLPRGKGRKHKCPECGKRAVSVIFIMPDENPQDYRDEMIKDILAPSAGP